MGIKQQENKWIALVFALVAAVGLMVVWAWLRAGPIEEPEARTTTSYGALRQEQIVVTASGAAGAASGSQDSDGPIRGHVYAMHLDYGSAISTTTDTTVTLGTPALTILAVTDTATDAWYYPAVQQTGSNGSGLSVYDRLPISGRLTAAVAESTSGSALTVTVWWGD